MPVHTNPEYTGPDRVTYINHSEPTVEELRSIPVGADIIIASPDGAVAEYWWNEEMADHLISQINERSDRKMAGHLIIYVNPDLLKEPQGVRRG